MSHYNLYYFPNTLLCSYTFCIVKHPHWLIMVGFSPIPHALILITKLILPWAPTWQNMVNCANIFKMNEWMNEWIYEWMNKCINNEWMNDRWMNKWSVTICVLYAQLDGWAPLVWFMTGRWSVLKSYVLMLHVWSPVRLTPPQHQSYHTWVATCRP